MSDCKEFQPRNSIQRFLYRRAGQVRSLNVLIQFANVSSDFRCFLEKTLKCMSSTRGYHVVFIKNDASKDMFPADRKKCLADKGTRFQCWMTFVVFGEKIEDHFFDFKGKCRRYRNYNVRWGNLKRWWVQPLSCTIDSFILMRHTQWTHPKVSYIVSHLLRICATPLIRSVIHNSVNNPIFMEKTDQGIRP